MRNQDELTRLKELLQRLTNQVTQKSVQIDDFIKDKSVVMLIGNTGAGKSTIANGLLGCSMKVTKNKFSNLIIINGNLESKAPKIATSAIKSQTSEVQLFELQDNKVLVDSPGFNDTRGCYTDIKNIFAIKNALKKRKSLKIVLIITKMDLQQRKYTRIIQLMEKLSKSLTHYDEDSFIIYATMCTPQWNKERVKNTMNKILTEIQKTKEKDEKVKDLYTFIIKRCQINLTYIPKQEGIYTLPDSERQKVLNSKEGASCTFDLQQFKFVSTKSASQVKDIITRATEEKSNIQNSIIEDLSDIKQIQKLDWKQIINRYSIVQISNQFYLISKQMKGYSPTLVLTGAAFAVFVKNIYEDKLERSEQIRLIQSSIEGKKIIIKKHGQTIKECKSMIQ